MYVCEIRQLFLGEPVKPQILYMFALSKMNFLGYITIISIMVIMTSSLDTFIGTSMSVIGAILGFSTTAIGTKLFIASKKIDKKTINEKIFASHMSWILIIFTIMNLILVLIGFLSFLITNTKWAFFGAAYSFGFLAGVGIIAWGLIEQERELPGYKFLAMLALPWFCTAPIVLGFSGIGLTFLFANITFLPIQSLSWQSAILLEFSLIIASIFIYQRGQQLEVRARNPLHGGLLEKTLREKYYQSKIL
jgi:hypothetical protein